MVQIGKPAPSFRAPALVAGRLSYLDSTQFAGRWTALCFLPYVGIVEPDFLDQQANNLDRIDTTLLIVSSGTRPLHRMWIGDTAKPRLPLLTDPLGRLHRSFGVTAAQLPARCQTFLIDRAGLLRFHLVHDFTDRGLGALQEILTMSQLRDSGKESATHSEHPATQEAMTASS